MIERDLATRLIDAVASYKRESGQAGASRMALKAGGCYVYLPKTNEISRCAFLRQIPHGALCLGHKLPSRQEIIDRVKRMQAFDQQFGIQNQFTLGADV